MNADTVKFKRIADGNIAVEICSELTGCIIYRAFIPADAWVNALVDCCSCVNDRNRIDLIEFIRSFHLGIEKPIDEDAQI